MRATIAILAIFASPAGAWAQAPAASAPLAQVYACAQEADDAARLACYDAAVGRLRAAHESGAVVTVERAEAEAIERDAFGFTLPSLPRLFGGEAPAVETAALEVARVTRAGDGRAVFAMTNGQVWRQVDTENSRRVRAGGKVEIRRAALGSYLMRVEAGGPALRVRREE